MAKEFYTYTVEFKVHKTWIADGFDLTDERAKEMLAHDLQSAHGSELRAKVLTAPDPELIAKAQGYTGNDLPVGIRRVNKVRRDGKLPHGN